MFRNIVLDLCRCLLGPIKRLIRRNKCLNKSKVKIQYGTDIIDTTFEENGFVAHHVQMNDASMGNYSSIGRYTKVRCADIGKYCSISWDCTIGAVEHPLTRLSTVALTYKAEYGFIPEDIPFAQKRTKIGNDVWIGCNVVIKSGVNVGDGAVIGGGSVCLKDVPPYAIVAGNPAKLIRYRIDERSIERLQKIQWWNWKHEDIKKYISLFEEDLNETIIDALEQHQKQEEN